MVVGIGDLVSMIPMAPLVAIMIMVSDRHLLLVLDQEPAAAPAVVVHRDARDRCDRGLHPQPRHRVLVGVLLSGILLRRQDRAAVQRAVRDQSGWPRAHLSCHGQVFYGSVEDFMDAFDFKEAPERVVIDVTHAHIWDISSVQALDMAILKFRRRRRRGGGRGHERGDRNPGRQACHPRQAGCHGQVDGSLREGWT